MNIKKESLFPKKKTLKFINNSIKEIKPDSPKLFNWHNNYVSNHIHRITFDYQIVTDYISPESKILEYGSVPLLLTAGLSKSKYMIAGVDIDPARYQSTLERLGVDVLKCDIEKETLPLESATFDAIIFFELFEHLRINPIFTMKEVARVLKPNGLLLLSSPNLKSLSGLRNFFFRDRSYSCCGEIYTEYEKLEKLGHMGHVREYNTTEVITFLERIGFKVSTLIYRGNYGRRYKQIIKLLPSLRPFVTYICKR